MSKRTLEKVLDFWSIVRSYSLTVCKVYCLPCLLVFGLGMYTGILQERQNWVYLKGMPVGGMAVVGTTLYWKTETQSQGLFWKNIPNPEQATVTQLFPKSAPTTTSTIPAPAKAGKRG
jgi:hypothetical protein